MEPERIPLLAFDLDPAFENFNFSGISDPTMKCGPSKSDLYRLVHKGRKGDRQALAEFADTVYWTLRPAAFDAFQREHGARAITYREWFYYKLFQFLGILLFTEILVVDDVGFRSVEPDKAWEKGGSVIGGGGAVVQLDELQDALGPEDNNCGRWLSLARTVSESSDDRLAVVQEWLKSQRAPQANSVKRSRWTKNEERDQIILNCLNRSMKPELICEELDKLTIATLPALGVRDMHRWADGWAEPEARKSIQQLISKLPKRAKLVKPPAVSK